MVVNCWEQTGSPVKQQEARKLDIKRLLISFSGGETSGYMLSWCQRNIFDRYEDVQVVFANTGQEREETLRFVDKCSRLFDVPVVWLEADVDMTPKAGTRHKIVDFESADRRGRVFEDMIKKYGIPNAAYPHCTRELKLSPITSYCRSIGWAKGSYHVAIGIRVDEIDRMDDKAKEKGIIYPLITGSPTTKPMINKFWSNMPFKLGLKGYEGNCSWCWKKSLRKHFTLLSEIPDIYDFPAKMEAVHGCAGANKTGEPRVFFRQNTSTVMLIDQFGKAGDFQKAGDDALVSDQEDWVGFSDLDYSGQCSESCEVVFD